MNIHLLGIMLWDFKETMFPGVLRALSGNANSGNFYMIGWRSAPAPQVCVSNDRTLEVCSGYHSDTLVWYNASMNISHITAVHIDVSDIC